jgi:hypothetical protein
MSGPRLVLDTNAVVALLKGSGPLDAWTRGASWIAISVITRLEFLAFSGLCNEDKQLFDALCRRIETIWLAEESIELLDKAVRLRQEHRLRLPDAIIAATAMINDAALITADDDFRAIDGLEILSF